MGEHLVVHVEQLVKLEVVGSNQLASPAVVEPSSSVAKEKEVMEENNEAVEEDAPLLAMAECRICQEEDSLNNLESPCACSGSLKYAHRKCVQHWCNEKGAITCEICHQEPNLEDSLNSDAVAVLRDNPTMFESNVRRVMAGGYVRQSFFNRCI